MDPRTGQRQGLDGRGGRLRTDRDGPADARQQPRRRPDMVRTAEPDAADQAAPLELYAAGSGSRHHDARRDARLSDSVYRLDAGAQRRCDVQPRPRRDVAYPRSCADQYDRVAGCRGRSGRADAQHEGQPPDGACRLHDARHGTHVGRTSLVGGSARAGLHGFAAACPRFGERIGPRPVALFESRHDEGPQPPDHQGKPRRRGYLVSRTCAPARRGGELGLLVSLDDRFRNRGHTL